MRCKGDSASPRLKHCHLALQLAGVIIGTVGFGIALTLEIPDDTTRDHRGIGIAVFSLGIFQTLMGFFKIHKGSRWRMHWAWVSQRTSTEPCAAVLLGKQCVERHALPHSKAAGDRARGVGLQIRSDDMGSAAAIWSCSTCLCFNMAWDGSCSGLHL